jgi:hypothetical protein
MDNQLQLSGLAAEINSLHDSAQQAAISAVEYAAKCGEKLIEAKAACKHGQFKQWIADNCSVQYRQAARYMKLANGMPQLSKSDLHDTFDSINTAIAYLSASEETQNKVQAAEEPVTEKQIKQWEAERHIRIHPMLSTILPPLKPQEFEGLERLILEMGCTNPLVLWNGFILDGHARYDICQKHNIPFKTHSLDFEHIEEAAIWIINNQCARTNLSEDEKAILIYKATAVKEKEAEEQSQTA